MSLNDEGQVDEEVVVDIAEEETTETDPVVTDDVSSEEKEDPETVQENGESDEEEDDRVVSIGDTEPEESSEGEEHQEAPGWVKKVRKSNRRLESEVKQLKRQLASKEDVKEQPVQLGAKPTLVSCGYDDAKYEQELVGYYERKRKVEEQAVVQQQVVAERAKKWQGKQERYVELKKDYNFKDYSDTEVLVENTLSVPQQQIILQGAEDSALLVYALGKNPKKLDELANVKDPVEFAFKVAKMESQLKVTNRKAPKPEKRVTTGKSGGISGNGDKTLDRLREEAAKSGDYTKVTAYKRQHHKG